MGALTCVFMTDLLSAMFQAQQQQQQQMGPRPTIVPLNSVVTSEAFEDKSDPTVVQSLLPFLPEEQQNEEELRQTFLAHRCSNPYAANWCTFVGQL